MGCFRHRIGVRSYGVYLREVSLEAMWHAYKVEADSSIRVALLNARYYDSSRGQFLTEEPIYLALGNAPGVKQLSQQDQQAYLSDPQQLNSYSYGRDNPITNTDTTGKQAVPLAGAVIGDVVGIGSQL
jgi:RHS repeat-associated protein